jgi:hypothetical protein
MAVRLNAKLVYLDEIRETFKRLRDEHGIDAGTFVYRRGGVVTGEAENR